jgi:hypothetical protein
VQTAATESVPPDKVAEREEAPATLASDGALSSPPLETGPDSEPPIAPPTDTGPHPMHAQTRKQASHERVHTHCRQGCSQSEIARSLQLDRRTVRRYLRPVKMPVRQTRAPRGSQLVPDVGFIRRRWEEGCHHVHQIFRELRTRGYLGSRSEVGRLVRWLRREQCASQRAMTDAKRSVTAKISVRQVFWCFVRDSEGLMGAEQSDLDRLCQGSELLRIAYRLAQGIVQMVPARGGEAI